MANQIESTNTPRPEAGDITPRQVEGISGGGINQERMDLYSQLGKLSKDSGSSSAGLQPLDLVTQEPRDPEKLLGAAPTKDMNLTPEELETLQRTLPLSPEDLETIQRMLPTKDENIADLTIVDDLEHKEDGSDKYSNSGSNKSEKFVDGGFDRNDPGHFIDGGSDRSDPGHFIDAGFDRSDPGHFVDAGFNVPKDSGHFIGNKRNAYHLNDNFALSKD